MKQYGDVVVLQIGKDVVNALVVRSIQRDEQEHLTLLYLHPSKDVGSFSGTQLDAAIAKAFDVAPWVEGAQSGWYPQVQTPVEPGFFVKFDDMLNLTNKIIAYGSDLEVSPNAAPRSATELIQRLADKYAASTEGVDEQLQNICDEHAVKPELNPEDAAALAQLSGTGGLAGADERVDKVMDALDEQPASDVPSETKHYEDGSSATGPAPLPGHSPDGSPEVNPEPPTTTTEG